MQREGEKKPYSVKSLITMSLHEPNANIVGSKHTYFQLDLNT